MAKKQFRCAGFSIIIPFGMLTIPAHAKCAHSERRKESEKNTFKFNNYSYRLLWSFSLRSPTFTFVYRRVTGKHIENDLFAVVYWINEKL